MVFVVTGGLWLYLHPQKTVPEYPVVVVEPAVTEDVNIYGQYVGRIRTQQFVEIRARVEGYLGFLCRGNFHGTSLRIRAQESPLQGPLQGCLASYETARLDYEQKVLEVFREVGDAVANFRSAHSAAALKPTLRDAASCYMDLAQWQYRMGSIDYLDLDLNLMDAHRRYLDAQIGFSNAVRDERLAWCNCTRSWAAAGKMTCLNPSPEIPESEVWSLESGKPRFSYSKRNGASTADCGIFSA